MRSQERLCGKDKDLISQTINNLWKCNEFCNTFQEQQHVSKDREAQN